jgi:4-diphosphocytidyl-2-C-methyl-D-erythritol kinase
MGAGLGGGSADAAAFLRAAIALYGLKIPDNALIEIATAVGQDVPFLLNGGTGRATGLGSTVAPLPDLPRSCRFLVVCPPIEVATRLVYEAVDGSLTSAQRSPALAARLESGQTVETSDFGNDLEATARRLFPALSQAIESLHDVLPGFQMSGSGAAFYAAFRADQEARQARAAVERQGGRAWLCRPVPAWR